VTSRETDVAVTVCSCDPNGRVTLADAMQNTNWTPLYGMETCDGMTDYNTVTNLID